MAGQPNISQDIPHSNSTQRHAKVNVVIIDTVTTLINSGILDNYYDNNKPERDDWKDHGIAISRFVTELRKLGSVIAIAGREGKGKSYGISYLQPGSFLLFNCDLKNPTYLIAPPDIKEKEAKGVQLSEEELIRKTAWKNDYKYWYGNVANPGILHKTVKPRTRSGTEEVPLSFEDILTSIKSFKNGGIVTLADGSTVELEKEFKIILLFHLYTEKTASSSIDRILVQGKMPTKFAIEGLFELFLIAEQLFENGQVLFKIKTKPIGNSTDNVRSPEGMFKAYIDNNYDLLLTTIRNYNN